MNALASSNAVYAAPKVATTSLTSRKTTRALASRPLQTRARVSVITTAKETIDRTTGYINADNSGSGNIFAIEPKQLYTESPTSDKYAKRGLGGIPGILLACGILAGVYFATQTLNGFEAGNQEFVGFEKTGKSLSYYIEEFEKK